MAGKEERRRSEKELIGIWMTRQDWRTDVQFTQPLRQVDPVVQSISSKQVDPRVLFGVGYYWFRVTTKEITLEGQPLWFKKYDIVYEVISLDPLVRKIGQFGNFGKLGRFRYQTGVQYSQITFFKAECSCLVMLPNQNPIITLNELYSNNCTYCWL